LSTQTTLAFDVAVRRPRARASDPETSHDAAQSISDISGDQQFILEWLNFLGPCTDEELLNSLPSERSPSGVRTRRSELVAMNLVRDSGKRRKTRSGRNAIVWEAV
jgi:hypothetical protein